MTAALLSCAGARILRRDAGLAETLDCTIEANRLALVGDWSSLFALMGHQASLVAGAVTLDGHEVQRGIRSGAIGLAPLDPPLPASESAIGYLAMGGELAGLSARDARRVARSALERLGIDRFSDKRIDSMDRASRRALVIAQSILTEPATLVAESPLCRLDSVAGDFVRRVLDQAARDRRLVVGVDAPWSDPSERSLLESTERVATLHRGGAVSVATPEELLRGSSRYVVATTRNGAALADALTRRGLTVVPLDAARAAPSGGGRLLVDLTPHGGSTVPVVTAALETEAPVVELVPVAREGDRRAAAEGHSDETGAKDR